jgi:hypothetical protein
VLPGTVQVADEGDLGAVVQQVLVDPPHDVDERFLWIAAVGYVL